MPWCPKCRNEYKKGFLVCADCGSELVENLDAIPKSVAYFGTEEEIATMISFLTKNGFKNVESGYDEKEDQYELLVDNVDDDDFKRAMSVYFRQIVPEIKAEKLKEQSSCFVEELVDNKDNGPVPLMSKNERYEKPEDRAVEYKSGAATLLIVGIIGIIALILADLGIIHFPMYGSGKILINVVMGGMFVAFIVLGFSSAKTYKSLTKKAVSDNDLEAQIMDWAKNELTHEAITADDVAGEAEEVLYFNRIRVIQQNIIAKFPDTDDSFVEYISEKVYSEHFE